VGAIAHGDAGECVNSPRREGNDSQIQADKRPTGMAGELQQQGRRKEELVQTSSYYKQVALVALGVTAFCGVSMIPSRAQTPPPKPSEETHLISSLAGGDLYQAYCAVCHGKTAKGDGPLGRGLKVAPPDLTLIAKRNGGSFPRQRIEHILSGETALPSGHGTREMPLWGPIFSQIAWDQDLGRVRIDNVAKYLEQLQTK
jgi:mono/diheme cytochrome c family protein